MKKKNLSDTGIANIENPEQYHFGIVVSEWNEEITNALLAGAKEAFTKHHIPEANIKTYKVPGAFELVFGAKALMVNDVLDAIVVLGCIIQGETPHFTFISQGVSQGISNLNSLIDEDTPIIFGVLTSNNYQEALDRAGGKYGNKGYEAAATAVKMALFNEKVYEDNKDLFTDDYFWDEDDFIDDFDDFNLDDE